MNEKYAFILGTTAEFIKLVPCMIEFNKRNIPYLFIHTGQHNLDSIIKLFGVRQPDIIIDQRSGFSADTGGALSWGLKIIPKLISYLKNNTIKFVIVQGDTISVFAGVISGKIAGKKVVHVEAGLRSGNLVDPKPEEAIRVVCDFLSDIKFAPSEKCSSRLGKNSYNVGNTCFDTLNIIYPNIHTSLELPPKYVVCTLHRHENIVSKEKMEKIINIVSYINFPILAFIKSNTLKKLKEFDLDLLKNKNIQLFSPCQYNEFIKIIEGAQFVISDSGGLAEECAALSVPYITLRNTTEREELLARGDQVLTKLNEDIAKEAIMKFSLPRKPYMLENVYDCGGASKQIVDILEQM